MLLPDFYTPQQIGEIIYHERFALPGEEKIEDSIKRIFENLKPYIPSEYHELVQEALYTMTFVPAGRIWRAVGNKFEKATAYNCSSVVIEDDLENIFETYKLAALVSRVGAGIGFNFSKLRPRNHKLKTTGGFASGPASFASIFGYMPLVISQGGGRRGATIGILDIRHPDYKEFADLKIEGSPYKYMMAGMNISLIFPESHSKYAEELFTGKKIDLEQRLEEALKNAWDFGEPGIIFLDRQNFYSFRQEPPAESVNPCGEEIMPQYGLCNLGSLNLRKIGRDEQTLKDAIFAGIFVLNAVIDYEYNKYINDSYWDFFKPFYEPQQVYRRVGLGFLGFGDWFGMQGKKYGDQEGLEWLMPKILNYAVQASTELARIYGPFKEWNLEKMKESPLWDLLWEETKEKVIKYGLRNSRLLSVAPTGVISLLAGASPGIEPIESMYIKRPMRIRSDKVKSTGTYSGKEVIANEYKMVTIKHDIEQETVYDIEPERKIKVLDYVQRYIDASISNTLILPAETTQEEVVRLFYKVYKETILKGFTVFRQAEFCETCG